jgi:hypothetical protein
VGLQEGQQGLALGLGDAGEPEGTGADEQPLAARVTVGADDRCSIVSMTAGRLRVPSPG